MSSIIDNQMLRAADLELSHLDLSSFKEPITVAGIELRHNYISGRARVNGRMVTFHAERQSNGRQSFFLDPYEGDLGGFGWLLSDFVRAVQKGWRTTETFLDLDAFNDGVYDYLTVSGLYKEDVHESFPVPLLGLPAHIHGNPVIDAIRRSGIPDEVIPAAWIQWETSVLELVSIQFGISDDNVIVTVNVNHEGIEPTILTAPKLEDRRWYLANEIDMLLSHGVYKFLQYAMSGHGELFLYGIDPIPLKGPSNETNV